MDIIITAAQIVKARAELAKRLKAASKAFRENTGYEFPELDTNIVRWLGSKPTDREIADKRLELASSGDGGTQLATLDLLTVKTEKAESGANKYSLVPYLPVKRLTQDGTTRAIGYQDPSDTVPPMNRIVSADGSTFKVLRTKGLLVVLTDTEIDAYVAEYPISVALYWALFF